MPTTITSITVSPFQLLQWKHAIRLEAKGMKVARRSVRMHAAKRFGIPGRPSHAVVLTMVEDALEAVTQAGVPMSQAVEIEIQEAKS